jgi:hypothetical protein
MTPGVDAPALLAALRQFKHRHRLAWAERPAAALTPLQQWERKVAAVLAWAERKEKEGHKTL